MINDKLLRFRFFAVRLAIKLHFEKKVLINFYNIYYHNCQIRKNQKNLLNGSMLSKLKFKSQNERKRFKSLIC